MNVSGEDDMTAEKLINRPHSYRGYTADMFLEAWENAETHKEEGRVRMALKRMEAGRFYDMLDSTHKMFVALDMDERESFAERNPNLMDWVRVFAHIAELNRFERVDYPSKL